MEDGKYTYDYKGEVPIPHLIMLYDLVGIAECGTQSAMLNSYIWVKTNSKKLQFGSEKCKKIHIGKEYDEYRCVPLYLKTGKQRKLE